MIRTLVIDDEPLALQQLAAYVGKIPYLTLVGECQSALEARDIIAREQIDAIFIDINMPDLNGMDFVRSLAAPPIVVFTEVIGSKTLLAPLSKHTCSELANSSTFIIVPLILISPSIARLLSVGLPSAIEQIAISVERASFPVIPIPCKS